MMNEQNVKSISFQEMLVLLKRWFLLILIAGIIGGGIVYSVCTFLISPVYEASAKMIVNSRQEQTGTVTNDQITSAQKLVDTYAIIIRSQTVLDPVVSKLNLNMDFEQLAKIITVTSVNDTQVMQIAVQSTDAVLAQQIVAEIVSVCPEIIIDAVDAGSVKTIEPSHLKKNPVAPHTNLYTLLAAFLCMFAAYTIVVIRFMMDNTYKSEFDLRNDLNLSVLGVIPDYDSCMKRKNSDEKEAKYYGKV